MISIYWHGKKAYGLTDLDVSMLSEYQICDTLNHKMFVIFLIYSGFRNRH